MNDADATIAERAEAVRAFDAEYGRMDRTLWTLSQACRPWLLRGEHSLILDEFVWTLKSWWGVQGVRSETKQAMGAALAGLDWAPEYFEETYLPAGHAETFACEVVRSLVSRSMELGVQRREFSLASKVLHWLMPWRVPVFDAFVRSEVGVSDAWDLPDAYRRVADVVFAEVREMADGDTTWMGSSDPRSLLHALDKWLWWRGAGGKEPPWSWLTLQRCCGDSAWTPNQGLPASRHEDQHCNVEGTPRTARQRRPEGALIS